MGRTDVLEKWAVGKVVAVRLVERIAHGFGKAGLVVEVAVGLRVLVVDVHLSTYHVAVLEPRTGVVKDYTVVVSGVVVGGEVGTDGVGGCEADDVAHVVFGDTGDHAGAFQIIDHRAFEGEGVGSLFAGAEEQGDGK